MADIRLRHSIAFEAARLMYRREETEYFTAKRKAAKRLCRGPIKPADLPSNTEIRELIQTFARTHEGESRTENLKKMRFDALAIMRQLCRFRPRLIGSVWTGHTRAGSDIDIHVFCDSIDMLTDILDAEGYHYEVERKQVLKHQETRIFTHVHIRDRFEIELTVYAENMAHYVFKSSITGKAIERASIAELEEYLRDTYPEDNIDYLGDAELDALADPYQFFELLLPPLAAVKQNPIYHPEGDALYHSLQVFELAKHARPWDEEFLLAALLHDVGKAIDPHDHVAAALDALDGLITERTQFLIAHHMDALAYRQGTLGHRQRTKLEASPDFDDLMELRDYDTRGRVPGARVGTVSDAINYLRALNELMED